MRSGLRPRAGEKYVLIVDDDAEIREALAALLEAEGYPIATASNGLEALPFLEGDQPPRVILLDPMMPKMDGREFIAAATRMRGDLDGIRIVMITALPVVRLNVAGILNKPLDLEALLGMVKENYA